MAIDSPGRSGASMPQFGAARAQSPRKSPFQQENEAVLKALAHVSPERADVKGGKGGFMKSSVEVNGVIHNLFLKPKDEFEYSNYRFIQEECAGKEESSILKFMPRVYGTYKEYVVMENLQESADGKWEQLADLKISAGGQSDQEELSHTNRIKGTAEQKLMDMQDSVAPNFLFLAKSKVQRSINAARSETLFTNALKSMPNELQKKLGSQFKELREQLKESPMAFIGASIFIFVSPDKKDVQIRLADPAHCIAKPGTKTDDPNIFYAFQDKKFTDRLNNNIEAVAVMQISCLHTARTLDTSQSMIEGPTSEQVTPKPRAGTRPVPKIGTKRAGKEESIYKVQQISEIELEEIKKAQKKNPQ